MPKTYRQLLTSRLGSLLHPHRAIIVIYKEDGPVLASLGRWPEKSVTLPSGYTGDALAYIRGQLPPFSRIICLIENGEYRFPD